MNREVRLEALLRRAWSVITSEIICDSDLDLEILWADIHNELTGERVSSNDTYRLACESRNSDCGIVETPHEDWRDTEGRGEGGEVEPGAGDRRRGGAPARE